MFLFTDQNLHGAFIMLEGVYKTSAESTHCYLRSITTGLHHDEGFESTLDSNSRMSEHTKYQVGE